MVRRRPYRRTATRRIVVKKGIRRSPTGRTVKRTSAGSVRRRTIRRR